MMPFSISPDTTRATASSKVLALPSLRLAAMGQAGRAWMARDYSWGQIAEELSIVYRWLLEGGDTPSTVRLN